MSLIKTISLIRPLNFLMVILTVELVSRWFSPFTPVSDVLLLAFATALILAAGNVHNDLLDLETDQINQKETTVTKPKTYYFLITTCLVAASVCYFFLNNYSLSLIGASAAAMLYVYNVSAKNQALIGNVVVAALLSISVLQVLFYDTFQPLPGYLNLHAIVILGALVFLTNLIREIIKDTEDIDGDRKQGRATFPIRFGVSKTRTLVLSILVITHGFLMYLVTIQSFKIYAILNELALLCFSFVFLSSKYKKNHGLQSSMLKGVMLVGLLSSYILRV